MGIKKTFVWNKSLVKYITGALIEWKPISENLMTTRFVSTYTKVTIFTSICIPTSDSDESVKVDFTT